jgi:hypothetical protein
MYNYTKIEFYNGDYEDISYLMDKIISGKRFDISHLTKTKQVEGTYTINVYNSELELIQCYEVLNFYDVIDVFKNNEVIKCDIIPKLHNILVLYLLIFKDDSVF